MATPRSMSDVTLEGQASLPDKFNPSITDTFLDIPSAEIVVVPWKVFQIFPEIMHPNFSTEEGKITYDGDVNILMSDVNLQPSKYGHLEDFTQTWVIPITTAEELDIMTVRLTTFPSLLSVTLTARNILEDSIEIPMVIFLSPDSQCIRDLVSKLGQAKDSFRSGKKFSVEVDIGPSMATWGKQVLRRELLSVGGRFVITSGAVFNHIFDWNNILGCVPCLPCGIIGSSVYRLHRKINYRDVVLNEMVGISILGAKGMAFSNQRHAVYLLMQWIRVFKMYYCIECRRRVPVDDSQKTSSLFCTCGNRPKTASSFGRKNKVSPSIETNKDKDTSSTGEGKDGTTSSRADSGHASSRNSDNLGFEGEDKGLAGDSADGQTDKTQISGEDHNQTKGQVQGGRKDGNVDTSNQTNNVKSKGQNSTKKKGEKKPEDKGGKFAPYKEETAGKAIERKKWMVTQNPAVDNPEWQKSMQVLKKKNPGGYVTMRTMFKYPAKRNNRKPGRRPSSSGFVEIELKRVDDGNEKADDVQADAETSEMTLPQGALRIGRHGYIDGDLEEEGFYFLQDEEDAQFDDDPLGQTDLKRFLEHISAPHTGTLNPSFNGGTSRPVTNQPRNNTDSTA